MKTSKFVLVALCAVSMGAFAAEPATTLRLMTYNIRNGWGKAGDRWNIWKPIEVIQRAKPDICAMQEVSWGGKAENFQIDVPTIMGHILAPMWRTARGCAVKNADGSEYGNAILFTEKELSQVTIPLPGEKAPRALLAVEFPDYWIATMHMSTTKSCRLKSVPIILDWVKKQTKPVILTGDWNCNPKSQEFAELRKGLKILSDETVFTCPTVKSDETIDYVAVDLAHADKVKVELRSVLTNEIEGSDHFPILMTLKIAK